MVTQKLVTYGSCSRRQDARAWSQATVRTLLMQEGGTKSSTRWKLGSRLRRRQAKLRKESHLVEIKVLRLDLAILNLEDRNAVNRDAVSGSWYLTLRCKPTVPYEYR
jgi:hypothetical protein